LHDSPNLLSSTLYNTRKGLQRERFCPASARGSRRETKDDVYQAAKTAEVRTFVTLCRDVLKTAVFH
jgi:hypothetical protein